MRPSQEPLYQDETSSLNVFSTEEDFSQITNNYIFDLTRYLRPSRMSPVQRRPRIIRNPLIRRLIERRRSRRSQSFPVVSPRMTLIVQDCTGYQVSRQGQLHMKFDIVESDVEAISSNFRIENILSTDQSCFRAKQATEVNILLKFNPSKSNVSQTCCSITSLFGEIPDANLSVTECRVGLSFRKMSIDELRNKNPSELQNLDISFYYLDFQKFTTVVQSVPNRTCKYIFLTIYGYPTTNDDLETRIELQQIQFTGSAGSRSIAMASIN